MTYKTWTTAAVAGFLLMGGIETTFARDLRVCASQHMCSRMHEGTYARDTRRSARQRMPAMKQDEPFGRSATEQRDAGRSSRDRDCDLALPVRCGWGSRGIGQWGAEQAPGTQASRAMSPGP